MNKKQPSPQSSINFAIGESVLSAKDRANRAKKQSFSSKILGRSALAALISVGAIGGSKLLEKVGQVEPSAISTILSAKEYSQLTKDGLPVITNISINPSGETINFRSSCGFEDSQGNPLNNIVFSIGPSTNKSTDKSSTLHIDAAIPVNGPSADPNVSQTDLWWVVPTGNGNQAVCVDVAQASRGADFGNVTTSNGGNAVFSEPDATATFSNNTFLVNGSPISHLQDSVRK